MATLTSRIAYNTLDEDERKTCVAKLVRVHRENPQGLIDRVAGEMAGIARHLVPARRQDAAKYFNIHINAAGVMIDPKTQRPVNVYKIVRG